jgi:hypothetical protein
MVERSKGGLDLDAAWQVRIVYEIMLVLDRHLAVYHGTANGGDERIAFIACLQCTLEQKIKQRVDGTIRHKLKLPSAFWDAINTGMQTWD